MILLVGFLLSIINATVQILDIANDIFPWDLAWFSVEGAPQYSFMAILVAMMVVWWPTEDSWKYGYQVQTNAEDEEDVGEARATRITMEDDDDIPLDSHKPNAEKKGNKVSPESIGAPEAERDSGGRGRR